MIVKNNLIESYKLEIHGDHLNGKVIGVIIRLNGLKKQKSKLDSQMKMMAVSGFLWKIILRFMTCFAFAKLMIHLILQVQLS